jgi:hypothetical protein
LLLCAHAGFGALIGQSLPHHGAALLLGLGSHAALDAIRHDDNGGDDPTKADLLACAFDTAATVGGIALLAWLGGWGSRATVGAISGALPDVELALPWNRRQVADSWLVFPSHAIAWLHSTVAPFRLSLRSQVALAALCWLIALANTQTIQAEAR